MSFLDARTQYRRTQEGALPQHADPHQLILITLRELDRSLHILATAQQDSQRLPSAHVTRALTAVYILQSSLDFEKGGDIADNLFRVYEFARLQLIDAFQKKPDARLAAARGYIADILSAWQQMPGKTS